MFRVGDLVSWRKTKELAIVIDIHTSLISNSDDIRVKFLGENVLTKEFSWYDSRHFEKVSSENDS